MIVVMLTKEFLKAGQSCHVVVMLRNLGRRDWLCHTRLSMEMARLYMNISRIFLYVDRHFQLVISLTRYDGL